MREHFEPYAFWLSVSAVMISLGTMAGVVVYTSKVLSSVETKLVASESRDAAQNALIQHAINAAHEKELQCKDMIHHFKTAKLEYKSCP